MNFMQRALRHLTRSKTKSLLLTLTFFLIANFVVVGFSISSAAAQAKTETRRKMNPVIAFQVDFDAWYEKYMQLEGDERKNFTSPKPDPELVRKMLADSRVKAADWMRSAVGYADGFEPVPIQRPTSKDEDDEDALFSTSVVMSETISGSGQQNSQTPDMTMLGIMAPQMTKLEDGTWKLASGRMLTQEEIDNGSAVAVIDKRLAEANNLNVGDFLKLKLYSDDEMKAIADTQNNNVLDLEIVGILESSEELSNDELQWASTYSNPANQVIIPQSLYMQRDLELMTQFHQANPKAQETTPEDYNPSSVIFVLNDPLEVDAFREQYGQNMDEFLVMDANDEMYQRLSKPLDTLTVFSDLIVAVVLINAVVIISLVSALTLKTRETEIGVLLSIGVSKVKIVAQLFTEVLITAMLGFILACATGSMIAGQVGEQALAMQVQENQNNSTQSGFIYSSSSSDSLFNEVSQEEVTASYHAGVNAVILIQIFILGIGVVFVSTLIPSLMVLRFNPKKILMSQN
ncbi:ABC transporter permease [Holdemania massiliensis]|uniref:ABC transporter permease n=1 Tax=Holdemania massiliensis TaxID=1468449 RepID=UPI001F0600B1|nr:ABC transporter permease [Holdemania massiliensis]MCH1939557.1 ABC transporter permease [Holdemania massiliensis]